MAVLMIILTLLAYLLGKFIQKKTGLLIMNPVLLSLVVIIAVLELAGINFATYHKGGKFIEFFLGPSVVALGVPLYKQMKEIKKQTVRIIVSQIAGSLAGLFSVLFIAWSFGASNVILCSLAPKSVSSPIAVKISEACGGVPSLTAAVVVGVGLFGAMFGYNVLRLFRIKSQVAQGLAIGTASHVLGTSTAMGISQRSGAYSTLGLCLNGIFTSIFTPIVLNLLGLI